MTMDQNTVQEILYTLYSQFMRDFTISDVQNDLVPDVLSLEEYKTIIEQDNQYAQIDRLFFLLIYTAKNLRHFIYALKLKYEWLSDEIQRLDTNIYVSVAAKNFKNQLNGLRDEIPKHLDLNVHRLELLWKIQSQLKLLKRRQHLVLHGNLLFGKRWLALDACSNFAVMEKMNFNIIWVNVSKCDSNEKILTKLERLLILLNSDLLEMKLSQFEDTNNKILMLKQRLKEFLAKDKYKDCLIVLANVQNEMTLKAFNLGSKLFITTRNKELITKLPKETLTVEVSKGLSLHESLQLFAKVLETPIERLPNQATDIHNLCTGNPFLISLIGSHLKENHNTLKRWNSWRERLATHKLTDDEKFRELIEISVDELSNDYKELFKTLVVFTDNVHIPISLLQLYWNRGFYDVEAIVKKLDKLYLLDVTYRNDGSMMCALQYHYYSYLRSLTNAQEKRDMHQKLVNCYNIAETMEQRTTPNNLKFPRDSYFYYNIGYHLKEAQMIHLFPKLFLDFGFLEEKLRATGLPNTLGDLKTYQREIIGNDKCNGKFFEHLFEFLPNVEELMIKSEDTSLLQYAITTFGTLKDRALNQAANFKNHIWFNDNDHTHKHRQIVPLPRQVNFVRFVEPNTALIALQDASILLMDLSTNYTDQPTIYLGHNAFIKDIQIFLHGFFVSLDEQGVCKIWSMKDTPFARRKERNSSSLNGHASARRSRSTTYDVSNIINGQCIQTFNYRNDPIQCLFMVRQNGDGSPHAPELFVGTLTGRIIVYEWDSILIKFIESTANFLTGIEDIRLLLMVAPFLLILGADGRLHFYNMKSLAKITLVDVGQQHPIGLYELTSNSCLITFKEKIIHCWFNFNADVNIYLTEIYSAYHNENAINCSVLSNDLQYLILGTRRGIIVFYVGNQMEILTISVSESIHCIDICSLDDLPYKYVLVSGTVQIGAGVALNGLEIGPNENIQLASNRRGSPINEALLCRQENLNAWLLGGKLFTAGYYGYDGQVLISAIDSKGHIHRELYGDDLLDSFPSFQIRDINVTAIASTCNRTYIGFEDGFVYELDGKQSFISLNQSVVFLKCLGNDMVVVSSRNEYQIKWMEHEHFQCPSKEIVEVFVKDDLVVLIKVDCTIEVFDSRNRKLINIPSSIQELHMFGGCDLKDDMLIVASKFGFLMMWTILSQDDAPSVSCNEFKLQHDHLAISCLKISDNTELFAIGFESGEIHLYDGQTRHFLCRLASHKSTVNDMLFSPWPTSSFLPIILVSVGEQVCFWNISYMLNNPKDLRHQNRRSSQRFSSARSVSTLSDLATPLVDHFSDNDDDDLVFYSPWMGKFGGPDKMELLACIKFVGNEAKRIYANKDFSQFNTIDDEGEIYNFKIINFRALSNKHK